MKRDADALYDTSQASLFSQSTLSTSSSITETWLSEGTVNGAEEELVEPAWVVPSFTADSMANGATGQSREVTDRAYSCLLDELVGDNVNLCDLVSENPRIYDILRRLTNGAFYCKQSMSYRSERDNESRLVFQFIMAWLLRLLNIKCWVLPIVLLSLWAWRSKVPKPFWRLLSRWRLLYSKETTEMIAADLGHRALRNPEWASKKLSFSVMDNCLVNFKTSFEGIREQGDGLRSYLMVNWLTSPVSASDTESPNFMSPSGIITKLLSLSLSLSLYAILKHFVPPQIFG